MDRDRPPQALSPNRVQTTDYLEANANGNRSPARTSEEDYQLNNVSLLKAQLKVQIESLFSWQGDKFLLGLFCL